MVYCRANTVFWWLIKNPDAGKDWGQEEKWTAVDEMVGWHHQLNGHEFEQTPGDSEGQGGLLCCSSWSWEQLNKGSLKKDIHRVYNRFLMHTLHIIALKRISFQILKLHVWFFSEIRVLRTHSTMSCNFSSPISFFLMCSSALQLQIHLPTALSLNSGPLL